MYLKTVNNKAQLLRKGILLVVGLFSMALGVSISVKADLGVTPISCVPYVYSLVTPFTLGELTIFMNCFFILLQIAILRKKYRPVQVLQLLVVILLGYFIDLTLYLSSWINPENYLEQLLLFLVSCVLLALGLLLFVKANVTYIPGDGLLVVISRRFKIKFAKAKMFFDCTMVSIGIASSIFFLHTLAGVREGTIIAALSVGPMVRFCERISGKLCVLQKDTEGKGDLAI